jgi:hypothetical protein
MSNRLLQNASMKNRTDNEDRKLEREIEGLTASQLRLLASIYAGLAEQLRQITVSKNLSKWKDRKIWN